LFAVYEKDGSVAPGGDPALISSLWAGGVDEDKCDSDDQGDPIVLYDQLADRWLISQFAWSRTGGGLPQGPFYECVAISQTGDPTGSYHLYEFPIHPTIFPDYPKIGLWPDGYHMTFNQFDADLDFVGVRVVVLERDQMLDGNEATILSLDLSNQPSLGGMLPADLDGVVLPPIGSPNYVAQFDIASAFNPAQLRIFGLYADFDADMLSFPLLSTIDLGSRGLSIDNTLCPSPPENNPLSCIPQRGTAVEVDALADRLMWRLVYRNFGTHEALLMNHTVDAGGDHAAVRWYEIRDPANGRFRQGGTYAPNEAHRWMGSLAIDGDGGIALGYSHSRPAATFPSIAVTGRRRSDAAGTMPITEEIVKLGTGSQTFEKNRWGDYTSMSVDPDDCTFWYTNQYYANTTPEGDAGRWRTAIASLAIPGCTGLETGTLTGTVTRNSVPIVGALVHAGTLSTVTTAGGAFSLDPIPAGTYTVTARAPGFGPARVTRTITDGGAAVANLALGGARDPGPDFDGDGFGDLAIGAPEDRQDGIPSGAVTVVYGSASGLRAAGDTLLHQDVAGVPDRRQRDDFFGAAVAAGDFDGDGFDDLAVGAHGEDIGGARNAGVVHVFPGSAAGIDADAGSLWHQGRGGVRNRNESGDEFGFALAAGDFDNDGRDDLAIGVRGENGDRGAVSVLYGSASGISARDQFWTQASRGVLDEPQRGDRFGEALAAGDFDGNNRGDLAIGVPREDIGRATNTGAVNVLYGRGTGLSARGDDFWHQGSRSIVGSNEDGDRYGTALAAGRLNPGTRDDLVVGIPLEDVDGKRDAGAISAMYGSADGLRGAGDDYLTRNSAGVAGAAGAGAIFGDELVIGDTNGDGMGDLIVGAPFDSYAGEASAGSFHVFFGASGGLTRTGDVLWTQHNVGASSGETGDAFALGLGIGDFNGDGFFDVAVGVPGEDTLTLADFGIVHEVPGLPAGPSSFDADLWHQDVQAIDGLARSGELFGWALTA
jgi:hypothetical protein